MPLEPWFEILKNFGIAGLFIAMYLTTAWYLFKELKESKKELREIIEQTTLALERSTKNSGDVISVMKQVQDTLEDSRNQISEFVAFQKGRDAR
jgi:hypothetical protein